ncbi:hypothetical protein LOAG_11126 [Loa loa]|uniref:Uncharacterized protein n=1 Tax=Loa loa TaxID=7209 RepID=A0A1S0TNJ9_LOALO|nr:hypothetical protein LOAG_11126 [Loa loa]EFO17371.1 hypothetical protein LOAG_11126 [Loa loa]
MYYRLDYRSEKEYFSLKFLFYLDYCLVFASLSLLNFSLAYIISLIAVPLIILFTAIDNCNRFSLSPLSMIYLKVGYVITKSNNEVSLKKESVKTSLLQLRKRMNRVIVTDQ